MTALVIRPEQRRWLNVFGNHTRVNLTSAETNGRYVVLEQRDPPGVGVPLHVHVGQDETFFVIQGQVRFQIGDETFVATTGTTVFAPRGLPHSFSFVGDTESHLVIFVVPGGNLESMFEELDQLTAQGQPDPSKVAEICGRYGCNFLPPAAG